MRERSRGAWLRRFIALAVLAVVAYYTIDLLRARADTPRIVREALSSDRLVLGPDDLSPAEVEALLAVQDPHFFTHAGWDFSRGTMTTITQSLVKGLYFESFRPGIRKIRQSLIARFALGPQMSKDDQLRLFINTIWLADVDGQPVVGFAHGAEIFYGKPFADLTFDEYLSLLMFDNPTGLNVHAQPEANRRRVLQIKRLLAGECRRPGLLGTAPHCWTEDPT